MIDKLIDQEIKKFQAKSYEIEERVLNNDNIVYLPPNQFALITYFQVKSTDSIFEIELRSDDKKIIYNENNCVPIQDPLNSRFYAGSSLFSIHRGYIQTIAKSTNEHYFLQLYLVNTYVN